MARLPADSSSLLRTTTNSTSALSLYLDGKPVLHVVDEATAFQAAKFLKDMSAKTTWDTLRICWIDIYQGPPDNIISDAVMPARTSHPRSFDSMQQPWISISRKC